MRVGVPCFTSLPLGMMIYVVLRSLVSLFIYSLSQLESSPLSPGVHCFLVQDLTLELQSVMLLMPLV